MVQQVFNSADFFPGKIVWDSFELDPDLPLKSQMEEFSRDLILVKFLNGCALDVAWYPYEFHVALNQNEEEWDPFAQWFCQTVPELRRIIKEAVLIAVARGSIPQWVFPEGSLNGYYQLNELKFDPLRPLDKQRDSLKPRLMELWLSEGRNLEIGWSPPFDPAGEFVVTMHLDERDWVTRVEDQQAGKHFAPKLLTELRCKTVLELVLAAKALLSEAEAFHVRSPWLSE